MTESNTHGRSPAAVADALRAGTGDQPLPPPPPPPWYFRRPVRAAAWAATAAACFWAGWVWHAHRTCEVYGQAVDYAGRPVAGAVVCVEGYGPAAVTDDDGGFRLHHRPAGRAWILVEVPGRGGVAHPIRPERGAVVDIGRVYLYTTN
jgi:hypothetical protein